MSDAFGSSTFEFRDERKSVAANVGKSQGADSSNVATESFGKTWKFAPDSAEGRTLFPSSVAKSSNRGQSFNRFMSLEAVSKLFPTTNAYANTDAVDDTFDTGAPDMSLLVPAPPVPPAFKNEEARFDASVLVNNTGIPILPTLVTPVPKQYLDPTAYQPTVHDDGLTYHCISMMPYYRNWSMEELRFRHWQTKHPHTQPPTNVPLCIAPTKPSNPFGTFECPVLPANTASFLTSSQPLAAPVAPAFCSRPSPPPPPAPPPPPHVFATRRESNGVFPSTQTTGTFTPGAPPPPPPPHQPFFAFANAPFPTPPIVVSPIRLNIGLGQLSTPIQTTVRMIWPKSVGRAVLSNPKPTSAEKYTGAPDGDSVAPTNLSLVSQRDRRRTSRKDSMSRTPRSAASSSTVNAPIPTQPLQARYAFNFCTVDRNVVLNSAPPTTVSVAHARAATRRTSSIIPSQTNGEECSSFSVSTLSSLSDSIAPASSSSSSSSTSVGVC